MGSLLDEQGYHSPSQTLWASFLRFLFLVHIENKDENHYLWRTGKTYFTSLYCCRRISLLGGLLTSPILDSVEDI